MDRVAGGMSTSGLVSDMRTISGSFNRSNTVCGDLTGSAGSADSAESDVGPELVPDLELDPESDSERE